MSAFSEMRRRLGLAVGGALLSMLALPVAVQAQSAPSDFTAATRYDASRRVTGTIAPDPDGSGPLHYAATRNSYDAAGRLIKVEKGELGAWQSETIAPANWSSFTVFTVFSQVDTTYDALDRKLVEKTSSGGTTYTLTQYSYDAAGRLECTAVRMNPAVYGSLPASACTLGTQGTQGPDRITKNIYDAAGQLLKVQKAYGTALQQDYATYTYSLNGKQTSVTDANGNKAALTYDGFDRQIGWYFPDKTTVGSVSTTDYEAYGYDANGNRTSLRKRDGRTLSYSYDALNRQTSVIIPDGCAPIQVGTCPAASATRDVYYGYDLRGLQLYARFDSASGEGVTSSYDGFGRQTGSTIVQGGLAAVIGYQYDADGNRVRITHPDGNFFVYDYDGLDRLAAIRESGATQVASISYNAKGERVGDTRAGVASSYGYDGVSRLTSLGHDLAGTSYDVTSAFSYNPASQIISRTRSNAAYAFSGYVNVNRAYAANGLNQYTSAGPATFSYDANGNLISDGSTAYGYDAENRLVTASNGAALVYDPQGRLLQTSGTAAGTTRYVYSGDELVAEYSAAGAMLRRYVHGAGEDDPLLWYEGAGLTDRRSLQPDHQGSIVSVADAVANPLVINSYDDYGIPAATNLGRFQYTGQAWIPELGMYYYKARIYSPTLGRFLQTDPIGYKDQINLYAYVANDPLNGTDPSGQDSLTCNIVDGKSTGCVLTPDKKDTTTVTINETRHYTGGDGKEYTSSNSSTQTYQGSISQEGFLSKTFLGVGDQILSSVAQSLSSITGTQLSLRPATEGEVGSGIAALGALGGAPRNLGNLGSRAGERAADVARSRGATGANLREMGPWADKPLGEVARAAAQGNQEAAKALKIVKEAARLGQKY